MATAVRITLPPVIEVTPQEDSIVLNLPAEQAQWLVNLLAHVEGDRDQADDIVDALNSADITSHITDTLDAFSGNVKAFNYSDTKIRAAARRINEAYEARLRWQEQEKCRVANMQSVPEKEQPVSEQKDKNPYPPTAGRFPSAAQGAAGCGQSSAQYNPSPRNPRW